ncbi:MAG: Dabb family protein [Rikenellaceae bacterium]
MKYILSICIAMLVTLTHVNAQTAQEAKELRHVVLFGFTETTTPAQIAEIEAAFTALPTKISEVKGYEWGTDCSPEGLQKGHTHCFFVTFNSNADRDAYLIHPAHKAFGKLIKGKVKSVTVIDYWIKDKI